MSPIGLLAAIELPIRAGELWKTEISSYRELFDSEKNCIKRDEISLGTPFKIGS